MVPAESRPVGGRARGVSLRTMEKKKASMRPNQKTGIETPMLAPTIVTTSTGELRLMAEITPRGMATETAMITAVKLNSTVSGIRSIKIWVMGRLKRMELPKSPRARSCI